MGGDPSIKKNGLNEDEVRRVKHRKIGVWDLYEEDIDGLEKVPGLEKLQQLNDARRTLPFAWRMLKDLMSLANCRWPLIFYVSSMLLLNLLPAITLWRNGQLLQIIGSMVESRSVDKASLIRDAIVRAIVSVLYRLLEYVKERSSILLEKRIKAYYSSHVFNAFSRLDMPTFNDPFVQRQLDAVDSIGQPVAWQMVQTLSLTASAGIFLISQVSILYKLLEHKPDHLLLALISFFSVIMSRMQSDRHTGLKGIWAATCRDDDYLKLEGMKWMSTFQFYRQEIVAGNLSDRLNKDFKHAQERVGDRGVYFHTLIHLDGIHSRQFSFQFLLGIMLECFQILFTFRAVKNPASIPMSFASLSITESAAGSFSSSLVELSNEIGSIAEQLESVRQLYESVHIKNQVVDGTVPYPENQQSVQFGVYIEFRNVSFKYPGSELFALKNVSFKIERGQLCVIVGTNGGGKSTILKLIARLYDTTEGQIFIDGHDIKTLKLKDLRKAMSILFQDFNHFPLCIRDSIGLGDPDNALDDDKIEQAAKEGGAYEFIEELPDKFLTYLDKPVGDEFSPLPVGKTTLFGRQADHSRVRKAGNFDDSETRSFSGGQMQRLAVSRTFMRSIGAASEVGLLLFDEPSASLDPQAEHDLFERLRTFRGSKTMMFSSHRFGFLTRHADVILYMNHSSIEEMGNHDTLLKEGGSYAKIYTLQASAFTT